MSSSEDDVVSCVSPHKAGELDDTRITYEAIGTASSCPASSSCLMPEEVASDPQFSGRRTLPLIPTDQGKTHHSLSTDDDPLTEDIARSIRWTHIDDESGRNNKI